MFSRTIFPVLLAIFFVHGAALDHARGGIINSSGAIQIIDQALVPNNIVEGNWESDDFLRVFSERENHVLQTPITVDIVNPGTYGRTAGFVPVAQSIGVGTIINSHYVHFDPIGTPGNMTRIGSISFDTDVVGIIVGVLNGVNVGAPNNTLGLSNAVLGVPRISYDVAIADLFVGGGDQLTLSSDRRSISFTLISGRGSDNVRILTAATVPEPERASAYTLIVALLGLVANRKRMSVS